MRHRNTLTCALIVLALLMTACSGSETATSAGGRAPTFNRTDVTFAQQMIPYHRQAVQMARLAEGRTSDPQVARLARRIEAAQRPEIATLAGWLQAWHRPVPGGTEPMGGMHGGDSMHGMSHGGGSMQGMAHMSGRGSMSRLRSATGVAFDRAFLTMMIEHHRGAVSMARTEQTNGASPDAIALAERIERTQTREIQTMRDLLGS